MFVVKNNCNFIRQILPFISLMHVVVIIRLSQKKCEPFQSPISCSYIHNSRICFSCYNAFLYGYCLVCYDRDQRFTISRNTRQYIVSPLCMFTRTDNETPSFNILTKFSINCMTILVEESLVFLIIFCRISFFL